MQRIVGLLNEKLVTDLIDQLIQICGLSIVETLLKILARRKTGLNIPVVHLCENILVINKPPDLVLNSNDQSRVSVQTLLKDKFPHFVNPRLFHDFYFVHRLDSATSGLLCIPLNKRTCQVISEAFEGRQVSKYYVALVKGHIELNEIYIDVPIGDDIRFKTTNFKMCTAYDWEHCLKPRPCSTKLLVLERGTYDSEFATKVLLQPVTGRRHQLRVHCEAIGHPIVGDYTYNGTKNFKSPPPRMMLHALMLRIPCVDLYAQTRDPFVRTRGCQWDPNEILVDSISEACNRVDDIRKI